eukprot:CAMPEP_0203935678 /NCGR_PEP_ID=MMETSP0359-20131031/73382_1 /ASSEMBLY_ACC=CAM_ASM_000338 /TAXON_ID=268821 /ORGANISM="Scrippsiella Hangoei, Strain SHTV-5" /LENGTH=59 /DNA_ID=CAMNT_0050865553 /DNA_START=159 /DNA_END=338 /DNA_ORIENTATION=-
MAEVKFGTVRMEDQREYCHRNDQLDESDLRMRCSRRRARSSSASYEDLESSLEDAELAK